MTTITGSSSYVPQAYMGGILSTIVFTLVNSKEFTVRLETMSRNVNAAVKIVENTAGAYFDWKWKRWIIPIQSHDFLQV